MDRISSVLPKLAGKACGKCGQEWARLEASGLCATCEHERRKQRFQEEQDRIKREADEQRQREITDLLGRLEAYNAEQLTAAGMQPRELQAEVDKIPRVIKAAIPRDEARGMMAGNIPKAGWGLIGTTGTGKTMALAAMLKANSLATLRERVPVDGPVSVDWIRWESWPILADWLRDHARSDPQKVGARLEAACTAPILVLDDLAAERRIGDYGSDYAVGKLDLIIDRRYRSCLPTWYTANVEGEAGLLAAYGARLVSRLCGENPPALINGHDMRMAP